MPSEVAEAPSAAVQVVIAPFIDFQFVLFLLSKREVQPHKAMPQWIAAREAENPAAFRRAIAFWPSTGLGATPDGEQYVEWGELLVYGWNAGVLFTQDVEAALDGIEAQLPLDPTLPPLSSEPQEIRDLIDRRRAYLRENAEAAADYMGMLRGIWAAIEPEWTSRARAEARDSAADLEAKARGETDLRRIVTENSFVHKDNYQPQISAARARGELYVIPMALGNEGAFYWAFPGTVLIGLGAGTPQKRARKRERMESASSRFKVLSDPTRLSILTEVMHGTNYNATTVTELASLFGMSQPTISVHMKMLREAGLVATERDGNRTLYTADEARVKQFVVAALEDLLGSAVNPDDC